MPEPQRGVFITLEGIDGSGKSTVARRLAEQLQLRGADVLLTREPGGTSVGERVRSLVLDFGHDRLCAETEALLFTASRAQLVADVIHPALRDGRVVISDRFADSTLAYQWGGRGLDRSALEGMQTLALQGIRPDLTFLFDVPPERALGRRRKEAEQVNRLDIESLAFYERVRNAYAILACENPNTWRIIDGSQTIEQVWDDVVVALNDNQFAGIKITAER